MNDNERAMYERTRRKRDCLVCCGRGSVTLAHIQPMTVAMVSGDDPGCQWERRSADYPCPACALKVSMDETATFAADTKIATEWLEEPRALQCAKESATHRIAVKLVELGMVTFDIAKAKDPWKPSTVTAVLGVISPKATASVEERIAERQLDVAQEIANTAKAKISHWGSYYSGNDGGISKGLAMSYVDEAVRDVKARRETPTPQETSPTSSSSALIDTACISTPAK